MKFSLEGKTAIVTGGGSGIGKAIAKNFASQGATIHILDFDGEGGNATTQEIIKENNNATFHYCDVSIQNDVRKTIGNISPKGSIDILINNAGIAHIGNIENTTEKDFDKLYNINIKGVYNCMKVCVELFKKNNGGIILNMASIASSVGISDRFAYSMSKGAVLTMTYSVAKDYINDNIRCNCISPGRVHTPFVDNFIANNYPGREKEMFEILSKTQPIGRMGKPSEIADLALFLCSEEASFITGSNYAIDGGFVSLNG